MKAEHIMKELVCIKQRLTAIETDIAWFKNLGKWIVVGVLSIFGIEVAPFIIG